LAELTPLAREVLAFAVASLAIGIAGTRLTALADRLADRTGLGEALMGGVFLGVSTSLPGITASVTAAVEGLPAMAVSNAMGGIAVQAAFLAVADVFHRPANLEHAAASVPNLMQASVLVALLCGTTLLLTGPGWAPVAGIDAGTPVLLVSYALGLRLVYQTQRSPQWRPRRTAVTVEDVPDRRAKSASLVWLWAGFLLAALVVMVSGAVVAHAGAGIVRKAGMSQSLMGGLFTAVSTSLPELVTTIAAVRRGALTLAVGDIVGGNAFDVLFVCVADVAYRPGSIYRAAGMPEVFLTALATLLNVVILMGLIRRERKGPGNIGFESVLVLLLYAGGLVALVRMG
jgi:cation:H+ antiporter